MSKGTMRGGMQDWPMTIDRFINHAARWHPEREIVSYDASSERSVTSYAAMREDALKTTRLFLDAGIGAGDRVATLAMNSAQHMMAWYAIAGMGAVCHTLNPRLGNMQLEWIANHAEDRIILLDGAFAELGDAIAQNCPSISELLFFSKPEIVPKSKWRMLEPARVEQADPSIWGQFPEDSAAGLCYTSGTTGDPKGVLYSHRSNVLHTYLSIAPDMFALSACDVVMPIVPLYHANAWGLAFSAPAVGAKLVMPGSDLSGPSLYERMRNEGVTFAAAVPTAWLGLLDHMEQGDLRLPLLERAIVGGAAMTQDLLQRFDALGIKAMAAWGMTELSPVGGVSSDVPARKELPPAEQVPFRLKQGRVGFGIDMRIVDDDNRRLDHDGKTSGILQMRGPAVVETYFAKPEKPVTQDGWLPTGDIATIDPMGYVKIVDRAKDVIKSGGEWISSIEIENVASRFPGIAMAAVIGVPHPRWDERPLLIVTCAHQSPPDIDALRAHLLAELPKWWLPDRIEIVDAIPLGATGKIDKRELREIVASDSL